MTEPTASPHASEPKFFRPLVDRPVGPHDPASTIEPRFVHASSEPLLNAIAHAAEQSKRDGEVPYLERLAVRSAKGSRLLDAKRGAGFLLLGSRLPLQERRAFWRELLVHFIAPTGKASMNPFRRLLNGGVMDEAAINAFFKHRPNDDGRYYFHTDANSEGAFFRLLAMHQKDLGVGVESPAPIEGLPQAFRNEFVAEIQEEARHLHAALEELRPEMPGKPAPVKPMPKKRPIG